jgi:hypothetical protein
MKSNKSKTGKAISLLIIFLVLGVNLKAQDNSAPEVQWSILAGGSGQDEAHSIKQLPNGNFIVVGSSNSINGDLSSPTPDGTVDFDYWLVNLNPQGKMLWQKSYDNLGPEYAYTVALTKDGGYIVSGEAFSQNPSANPDLGKSHIWILKLDKNGIIQWQKQYGGSGSDCAYSIVQTNDNGYIVASSTSSNDGNVVGNHGTDNSLDAWILKLDQDGKIQWQKCYGGTGNDVAKSILQTSDGGYIFAGETNSNDGDIKGNHGNWDFWVVKINSNGNIEWSKVYGGTLNDKAQSIEQTKDGNYVVSGWTRSSDGDVKYLNGGADFWVIKLNQNGQLEWEKTLGGSEDDFAYTIANTTDGNYVVAGESKSSDGDVSNHHIKPNGLNSDGWIVKLSSSGSIIWEKSIGGNEDDVIYSIQQTNDKGFIVAGKSFSSYDGVTSHGSSDFWVVKLK